MNSTLKTLQDPHILQEVFKHLNDPLEPNNNPAIESLVKFPLKNPIAGGGLTPEAEESACQIGHLELLTASQTHKEKTRIQIQAILKICQLYLKKQKPEGLSENDSQALRKGIAFNLPDGKIEFIVAIVQGGELLSKPIKKMMNKLFRKLKEENSTFQYILQAAAQKHSEKIIPTTPLPSR